MVLESLSATSSIIYGEMDFYFQHISPFLPQSKNSVPYPRLSPAQCMALLDSGQGCVTGD